MHHACSCHAEVTHIVEPPARSISSGRLGATTTQVLLPPPWGGVSFIGAEPPAPLAGGEWRARVANHVELAVNIHEEGMVHDILTHCTCRAALNNHALAQAHASAHAHMHMPCEEHYGACAELTLARSRSALRSRKARSRRCALVSRRRSPVLHMYHCICLPWCT